MPFLTVTPNLAIDRTLVVPGFGESGVYRTDDYIVAAGGKGINVARVMRALGEDVICAGFVGGHSGRLLADLAQQEGLRGQWTQIAGETRTCTIIGNPETGRTAIVNETGPQTDTADWSRLHDDVLATAADCAAVCLCGSLPPGSPGDAFSGLLRDLVKRGKSVWVDSSGAGLRAAVQVADVHVKINEHEAAEVTGQLAADAQSARTVAEHIQKRTQGTVALTLGKQGAILVEGSRAYFADVPAVPVSSAVGSGDAFLAGLLVGLQDSVDMALKYGVAAGSANATTYGGGSFPHATFEQLLRQVTVSALV